MTLSREEMVARLSKLITLNKDSAKGFIRAENDAESESLSDWFNRLAGERAELVDDLQKAIGGLGAEADEEASAAGALARGWLNIKSAMTIEHDKTDAIILADRLDHEEEVLEAYEEMQPGAYPQTVAALLQKQTAYIRDVRESLAQREATIEEQS